VNRAGRRSLPRLNHAAVRDQPNAATRAAERAEKGNESVSMVFFFGNSNVYLEDWRPHEF
jgi:hypothetical protein